MRRMILAASLIGFSIGGAFAQTPSPAGQNSTSDKQPSGTMSKDSMSKDSMAKDKGGAMAKDTMKDGMSKDSMAKDKGGASK